MLYKIYIGSNNTTKELELDKITSVVNKYYDGYTIIQGQGYWKGEKENTAIIEIYTDTISDNMLLELKTDCKQDSLLVSKLSGIYNFIQIPCVKNTLSRSQNF